MQTRHYGLSSCGTWAHPTVHGISVPQPGIIQLASPALEGELLTPGPWKSQVNFKVGSRPRPTFRVAGNLFPWTSWEGLQFANCRQTGPWCWWPSVEGPAHHVVQPGLNSFTSPWRGNRLGNHNYLPNYAFRGSIGTSIFAKMFSV